MEEPATQETRKVQLGHRQDMSLDERMESVERNLDLCLNYVRHLAQLWLSVEKIRSIEAELADGE